MEVYCKYCKHYALIALQHKENGLQDHCDSKKAPCTDPKLMNYYCTCSFYEEKLSLKERLTEILRGRWKK